MKCPYCGNENVKEIKPVGTWQWDNPRVFCKDCKQSFSKSQTSGDRAKKKD